MGASARPLSSSADKRPNSSRLSLHTYSPLAPNPSSLFMLTRFVGNALAVAQVDTLTIGGTIEVGDRFRVTINGKTFVHSAGTTVAATEATALAAAWNAL